MDQRILAKKTSNALDRLDGVEKRVSQQEQALSQIVGAINNSFNQLNGQVAGITEVLDAVVQELGQEVIQNRIAANRLEKAQSQAAAEKLALEELVTKGELVVTETVTEKSVVVGRETTNTGDVRPPGRAQVAYQRIDPQFQANFLGQKVGFSLDLPTGGKFELQEIYEVVEAPVSAPGGETVDAEAVK